MRTFFACCAALLIAASLNLKVSAQGGAEIKIQKKVEKKIRQKGDHRTEQRIVLRSADGDERVLDLATPGVKTSREGYEVIDLGEGRKAIISIQTDEDEKEAARPRLRWQSGKDGAEATIEVEIDSGEGHEHHAEALRWIELDRDHAEAGHDDKGRAAHPRMLVLKGRHDDGDEDDDEISVSIEGLEPMLGHIMQYVDLEEIGPMIGALLGDMDIDVEVEGGRIEIEAEGLHRFMKQPGVHDLLLQHLGQAEHGRHGEPQRRAIKLPHPGSGAQQFRISPLAPGAHQVVITDADCECECDCACCKAGKCATPKKPRAFFLGQSGETMQGRVTAPEVFHLDTATQSTEAPQGIRRRIVRLADPAAPKASRHAIAITRDDDAAARRRIATIDGEAPGRVKVQRLLRDIEATPAQPTRPSPRGGDLGDIEKRIDRLSSEMKALQKELRALRRKI